MRSGLLARLERCVFVGPFRSVFDTDSAATYVFADCRFEAFKESFRRTMDRCSAGVRFDRCQFVERKPEEILAERIAWLASVAARAVAGACRGL